MLAMHRCVCNLPITFTVPKGLFTMKLEDLSNRGDFHTFLSCSRLNLQTFFVLKLTRPDSIHTYHLDVDKNKCMQVHLKHFRFYIFWRGYYNLVRRRRKFMK